MKKHFFTLVICIGPLLYGCSTLSMLATQGTPEADATDTIKKESHYAPFEPDTLYELLVAELGGQQQRYDLALGNYLTQAHNTQDTGIAKRAYEISTYIDARQAALDAATLWATLAPDDTSAQRAHAFELISNDYVDQGIELIQKILAQHPQTDFQGLASRTTDLSESKQAELLEAFQELTDNYPKNYHLKLTLAAILLHNQAYDEAIALCDILIKKDIHYTQAIILKGRILHLLGHGAEAEQLLALAVKQHPDLKRLRLLYARVLVGENKLGKALDQFLILSELLPNNTEIMLSLGLIFLDLKETVKAQAYFQQLLSLGKHRDFANFYMGKSHEQQKQWDQAISYFSAVTPGDHFFNAQAAITHAFIRQQQWSKARQQLATARVNYPKQAGELYLLEGEWLVKHSQLNQAVTLYQDALARFPNHIGLLYARAMLLEKLEQWDLLEQDLRKILSIQPDNTMALNALGYTFANRSVNLKEALALILKAHQINSADPAILDSLGWVQYRLGNLDQALDFLQKAYNSLPDAEIAAHLSEVLWQLGRKDEARNLWNEVLKSSPTHKIIKETINRLDQGFTQREEPLQSSVPGSK